MSRGSNGLEKPVRSNAQPYPGILRLTHYGELLTIVIMIIDCPKRDTVTTL